MSEASCPFSWQAFKKIPDTYISLWSKPEQKPAVLPPDCRRRKMRKL
ncbi:hypothetical protein [Clostridium sp. AN503]